MSEPRTDGTPSPLLLGPALLNARGWQENSSVLLPFDQPWSETTPCLIHPSDPYEEDDARVELRGVVFEHALQKEQVEDVLASAEHRLGRTLTQAEAFEAFLFYVEHDAFM